MTDIECLACEKPQDDTPPTQHITTDVDAEIPRHRLNALIKRLEEWEADIAPHNVVYNDIDGLFDEDGNLKYFNEAIWTDEDLEERVSRRNYMLTNALSRLGYAYQKQKRQLAELKDSYDTLKAKDKDVNDGPLTDEDCPKCKKLRSELSAEQIQKANAMLRAFSLEQKVDELSEELKEAKTELEVAGNASFWENILLSCLIATLGLSFVASVISLIFS